jgi:hypothetical protein
MLSLIVVIAVFACTLTLSLCMHNTEYSVKHSTALGDATSVKQAYAPKLQAGNDTSVFSGAVKTVCAQPFSSPQGGNYDTAKRAGMEGVGRCSPAKSYCIFWRISLSNWPNGNWTRPWQALAQL